MFWFLAPIVAVAAKLAVDAWQEHEAAERRQRERDEAADQARELVAQREAAQEAARAQKQAQEQARHLRRAAAVESMRRDYHQHLRNWLHHHHAILYGTVPEPGEHHFRFAELVNLPQAGAPADLAELIRLLKPMVPNLALGQAQQQHWASTTQLQDQIVQLQQLENQIHTGELP